MIWRRTRPEHDRFSADAPPAPDAEWLRGQDPVDAALAARPERVVLLAKPGCHLCDDARTVVEQVCSETGLGFAECSTLDDVRLEMAYWQDIPVVLVDGRRHARWRVDPDRLHAALG